MIYRRFGRTNLQMPVFTCGGMRYQHKWNDVPASEIPAANQQNLERTIRRAIELGINHIETARGYGTSEMQLGRILPTLPRESIIVQTKVAPCADPKEFLANFETSMSYLGLEHVDLLSLHGINHHGFLEQSLRPGGCLDVARRLQREGRVRFIGFSTHGQLDVIRAAIRSDAFDYVNLHWYWVNDKNWPAIMDAAARDMGVFIISPNDKGGKLYSPPEKLLQLCEPLSPMEFNNLYCLSRPQVHTLSIGAARPEDFDHHVESLQLLNQAQQLLPPILRRLRSEMEEALGAEWLDRWEDGLPDWEQTPGQVHVWEILRLWNVAHSLDMVEFARMRYNLLGNADHWFPGETAAAIDSLDLLPCLKEHPFPERVISTLRQAHELLGGQAVQRLSKSD